MAVYKCKMCGGNLEFIEGAKVGVCDCCGTKQTLPSFRDDEILNLHNRANVLRLKCEFDKAEEIYNRILEKVPDDAEAHWGIILCKYGIEYVKDAKTGKMMPTCHRTSYDAIAADEDFKSAYKNAYAEQQHLYAVDASKIDKIQKNILNIVKNEKPFDVFICYKEKDENNNRTNDSGIAAEVYYKLVQEGYKVFYAPITLESKLGEEFEPYIFAALQSSKVMLVVGTKPEYFNAVWVRNEWSRFMKLMKTDKNKLLVPCYKDMDAYELPEEFAHLQAQDMSRVAWIYDIISVIKKVAASDQKPVEKVVEIHESTSFDNTKALIKRAWMSLEDGDFKKADSLAENALNINPEECNAYMVKLCVQFNVSEISELKNCDTLISDSSNFQRAYQFASPDQRAYLKELKEENENAVIFEPPYNMGVSYYNSGLYSAALTCFSKIQGYKSSDEYIEQCKKIIEQEKIEAEEKRKTDIYTKAIKSAFAPDAGYNVMAKSIKDLKSLGDYKDALSYVDKITAKIEKWKYDSQIALEAEKARAKKEKRKRKIVGIILLAIAVVVIILSVLTPTVFVPLRTYNEANDLLLKGEYWAAKSTYSQLNGFKDSNDKINKINVRDEADGYFAKASIATAVSVITANGGYININYDCNGGYVSESSKLTKKSVTNLNSFDTFVPYRDGNNFLRWNMVSWNVVYDGENFYADINLVAAWEIERFNISYNLDGGKLLKSNPTSYNVDDYPIVINNPTKEGYTFDGWTGTNLSIKTSSIEITKYSTGDRDYFANWEAMSFTITYDANGGKASLSTQNVLYDSDVVLASATKTGYSFGGWLNGNDEIKSGKWKITKSITLKALWVAENCTKYVVNHYLENADDNQYSLDSSEAFIGTTLSSVTPSVKSFDYFKSPTKTTVTIKADGTSKVDYYYTRYKYSIDIYPNNGHEMFTKTLKYGATIIFDDLVKREGYTVDKFYQDVTQKQVWTAVSMPAKNVLVYVGWKKETSASEFQFSIANSKITIEKFIGSSKEIIIPEYIANLPVDKISEQAFAGAKIIKIIVPHTCTAIGDLAFYQNDMLEEIYIPDSVTYVGKHIVSLCKSLRKMTIPFVGQTKDWNVNNMTGGPTTLLGYYFSINGETDDYTTVYQHYKLTSNPSNYRIQVRIPNSLTIVEVLSGYIGYGAFENCSNIRKIVLHEDVSYIGFNCVKGCSSLEELSVARVGTWYMSKYEGFSPQTMIDILNLTSADIISLINDDHYALRKY